MRLVIHERGVQMMLKPWLGRSGNLSMRRRVMLIRPRSDRKDTPVITEILGSYFELAVAFLGQPKVPTQSWSSRNAPRA